MLVGNKSVRSRSRRNSAPAPWGPSTRRYTKTGQRVAIKVMAPGLGANEPRPGTASSARPTSSSSSSTPTSSAVSASGKYHGTPLLRHGVRRGRIARPRHGPPRPHDLGGGRRPGPATLCRPAARPRQGHHPPRSQAVQPHGPAPTAPLKLTDFGIAKDLDVTALTAANCTVGTAVVHVAGAVPRRTRLDATSPISIRWASCFTS